MSAPPSPAKPVGPATHPSAPFVHPSLLGPHAADAAAATSGATSLTPVRSREQQQQQQQQQQRQREDKASAAHASALAVLSTPPRSAQSFLASPAPSASPLKREPREEKAQKKPPGEPRPDLGGPAQRVPVGKSGGAGAAAANSTAASSSPARAVAPTSPARLSNVSSPVGRSSPRRGIDPAEAAALMARKKQEEDDAALVRRMLRDEEGGADAIEDDDDERHSPAPSASRRSGRKRPGSEDEVFEPESASANARKTLGRAAAAPAASASKRARVERESAAAVSGPKPTAAARRKLGTALVQGPPDMDDSDVEDLGDKTDQAAASSMAAVPPPLTRTHGTERSAAPAAAAAAGSSIASLPMPTAAAVGVAGQQLQTRLLDSYIRQGGSSMSALSDREKSKAAAAEEAARAARKKKGALSLPEMAKLYHLDVPACGGKNIKKACPLRPNCLHGLGYHRQLHGSIWSSRPSHLSSLGPDPSSSKRHDGRGHAGLKNLGALCYLNTLFQTLFMNEHFRRGIYKFRSKRQREEAAAAAAPAAGHSNEDDVQSVQLHESKMDVESALDSQSAAQREDDADAIVSELQSLFARLEFGKASFEDPCRIVSKLKLARGEQQDVNEFNNLFLQHLEARLKLTEIPGVATLIDDEFRGSITHAVTCSNCGTASQNPTPFYDITLQISRMKTVQQAMLATMQNEHLSGSNQYRCGKCKSPQNAVRSTVITQLPPVLNLQLLRFAYDPLSDSKKKLTDNISIPARIDMAPFKSEEQIERMVQALAIEEAEKKNGAGDAAAAASSSAARPASPAVRKTGAPAGAPSSPSMRGSSSSSSDVYELTAILRHKGTSAYHGHYIADIRDPQDPLKWWRFDDDKCTPLAQLDDGTGAAKPADGDEKKKGGGKKKGGKKTKKAKSGAASGSEDDDDEEDDDFEGEGDGGANGKDEDVMILDDDVKSIAAPASPIVIDGDEAEHKGGDKKKSPAPSLANICSRNAYMLVYTRVGRPAAPVITRADLTPAMETQIRESDEGLKKRVVEWIERKEKLERLIDGRKAKCDTVWALAQADEIRPLNPHELAVFGAGMSPPDATRWIQQVANPDVARAHYVQECLKNTVFINAQWLTAWFTGLTEEAEYTTGRFKGSKDDAIDLSGGPSEDEQLRQAQEESKREAEQLAAKQKAKLDADEAEATRRSMEDTTMKPIVEEKGSEDALIGDDTTMEAAAASSSAAAAACSSSAAAAAAAPPSSPRAPPPPILMHPLWPGDLHESLLQLFCEHNRPDPRNPNLKRINREAWKLLADDNELQKRRLMNEYREAHPEAAAAYENWQREQDKEQLAPDAEPAEDKDTLRGAPELSATDLCQVCCNELSLEHDKQDAALHRRDKLLGQWSCRKDGYEWTIGIREPSAMLVSKSFLKTWVTKATAESTKKRFTQQSAEEDANKAIVCVHKGLETDRAKNREVVPGSFWEELLFFYPKSTPFPRGMHPCAECVRLEHKEDLSDESWRDKHHRDLEAMPSMLKQLHVDFPNLHKAPATVDFVLVPGQWAAEMIKHLKSQDRVDLPKWIDTTTLLCQDHGKLLFNPVPVQFVPHHARAAPYDLPGTEAGRLALMGSTAWDQLRRYKKYFRDEDKPMPAIKMHVKKIPGMTYDHTDWNTVSVTTDPPPCPDCVMVRIHIETAERIGWEVGQLQIKVMVAGQQLPDAPADAAAPSSGRPKRTTRAKPKEPDLIADFTPEPTAITSRNTLMELKLQAMQHSSIVPAQQELFIKGRQLLGDNLTLAQLEVPAVCEIYVRVNLDGDADFPFAEVEPAADRRKRPARPEAGFSGTALSSGMPRARAAAPAAAAGAHEPADTSTPPAAAAAASSSSLHPSSSPPPVSAAAAAAKTWSCSHCTYANAKLTALACEICGEERRK